ncbi:MAG: hypothetical protein ACLGG9_03400 [Thermoleophilia bacterium]|jgi:hypothetical protein
MVTFAAIIATLLIIGGLLFAFLLAGGIWFAISSTRPELLDRTPRKGEPPA